MDSLFSCVRKAETESLRQGGFRLGRSRRRLYHTRQISSAQMVSRHKTPTPCGGFYSLQRLIHSLRYILILFLSPLLTLHSSLFNLHSSLLAPESSLVVVILVILLLVVVVVSEDVVLHVRVVAHRAAAHRTHGPPNELVDVRHTRRPGPAPGAPFPGPALAASEQLCFQRRARVRIWISRDGGDGDSPERERTIARAAPSVVLSVVIPVSILVFNFFVVFNFVFCFPPLISTTRASPSSRGVAPTSTTLAHPVSTASMARSRRRHLLCSRDEEEREREREGSENRVKIK